MAATYTVRQVAQILGYSTNSIYTFLKENRIEGVRVGKGRIRIPQSELNRLLLLKKQPETPVTTPQSTQPVIPKGELPSDAAGVQDIINSNAIVKPHGTPSRVNVGLPEIFDWFVGAAGVISGFALFLFNTVTLGVVTADLGVKVYGVLRIVLIASGFGILLTNIFRKNSGIWRSFFLGLLAAAGSFAAIMLGYNGDMEGSLIYGSLALIIFLSFVLPLGSLAMFSLYLSMLTVVGVVRFVSSGWQMTVALIVAGLVYIVMLWVGYLYNRKLFWFATWLAAFASFGIAFYYAELSYWSRSFFFVVLGITSMFAYVWEEFIEIKSRKMHMVITGMFLGIFVLLLIGIAVVKLMQVNVMTVIEQEDVQNAAYARIRLEIVIENVQKSLSGFVTAPEFIDAIQNKDHDKLDALSRVYYDANKNVRRVITLDSQGQGIHIYPDGIFTVTDFSFRDYFIHARDVGQMYVTGVFESRVDNASRKVVAISAPVYKDNVFIGVAVASLDLDTVGQLLQQIVVPERKEIVTVVDSKGVYIIGPTPESIGTQAPEQDVALQGIDGERGSFKNGFIGGTPAVTAYDGLRDYHWGIAVWSPLNQAYEITRTSTNILFFLLVICVLVAIGLLQAINFFWKRDLYTGGSP